MKDIQRSYNSEADLPAVLALKQVCTTAQNIYDRPTTSDLRRLLNCQWVTSSPGRRHSEACHRNTGNKPSPSA
jgi:hypothetical protein